MANVHVVMKSSSTAPPSAAHSDYISREGSYAKRGGVELVESGNMPEFAQDDPRAFWVAADTHERVNGRTYTELQIALPRELGQAQREELAREATRELLGDRFAYTLAIHRPLAQDNIEQPHMHLMFSERAVDEVTRALPEEQFFKRNGAKKDPAWNARTKPEEVRVKWCEMMNRAMEKENIDVRVDPRSWADQGREDLHALIEPKMLGGDGEEASALRKQIEDLRQQRQELPAMHLDDSAALQRLQQEEAVKIAEIQSQFEEQYSILDKMIAAAREMVAEVRDKVVGVVRNFAEGVSSIFGAGNQEAPPETVVAKGKEEARPTIPRDKVKLDKALAELDHKLSLKQRLDAKLANLDKRLQVEEKARQLQEHQAKQEQKRSPQPIQEIEKDRGGIHR